MKLEQYFTKKKVKKALESYQKSIVDSWPIDYKLELYTKAKISFDSKTKESEKMFRFNELFENLVGNWQIFRPISKEKCWEPEKIFNFLSHELNEFGRNKDLLNIKEDELARLKLMLEKMHSLKPLKDNNFPTMAVTKILHFYNPKLFPIYDSKVIENIAFTVFRNEYRDFCYFKDPKYVDKGTKFIKMYIMWAKNLLIGKETKEIMNEYVDFIKKNVNENYFEKKLFEEMHTYYASAFENIFIGAAFLEKK